MSLYRKHSNEQLTELLRTGDNDAFLEIYKRFNGLLFAYAYRKLQDKQEAQDVVQEVFIGLWERHETLVIKTNLAGVLYKSVLNKVLDIWKHSAVVRRYLDKQPLTIDIDSTGTDYLVREKEIASLIEREIAAMPPRTRQAYLLRHRQYMSIKEIATEMGTSEHTVSNQLKSAAAHLKSRLGLIVYILYILNR